MKACTPLWAAAAAGHLDIVELLIEQKVEVDGRVGTGSTPLRGAVCDGRIDIIWLRREQMLTQGRMMITHDFVECFLKHYANVNFQDKDDYTALHSATRWGYTAIFDKFLSHKGLQPQNNHV